MCSSKRGTGAPLGVVTVPQDGHSEEIVAPVMCTDR